MGKIVASETCRVVLTNYFQSSLRSLSGYFADRFSSKTVLLSDQEKAFEKLWKREQESNVALNVIHQKAGPREIVQKNPNAKCTWQRKIQNRYPIEICGCLTIQHKSFSEYKFAHMWLIENKIVFLVDRNGWTAVIDIEFVYFIQLKGLSVAKYYAYVLKCTNVHDFCFDFFWWTTTKSTKSIKTKLSSI